MWTGGRAVAFTCLLVVAALVGCTPGSDLAPAAATGAPTATPATTPEPSAAPSGGASPSPGAALVPVQHAPTATYPVGVREFALSRGDRPLRTVVWYPATAGRGGPGAMPAPGAYPLVLFSHGLGASPEAYQILTTRLAAAGFVVAGPAYPYTNAAASVFNPVDLVNQPADASAVITEVLALNDQPGEPLAGHIDPARVAAAGHSAGGYTTVGLLAGARDVRVRAAVVIAGGTLGGAFTAPPTPVLFVHGDKDPVVSYSVGRATYAMVPWSKAFLTVSGGDHVSYLSGTSLAAVAVSASMLDFLRWTLYRDDPARARLPDEAAVTGVTTFEAQ